MQAYIASITKSYVDWDSNPSIILYFAGCDFRCPYCFAADILDSREIFLKDLKEVKNQIRELSYSATNIYFTGGEPCLQKPSLLELAKFSKKIGLRTGLQTNGSNPRVVRQLLRQNLLDYISLDLKAPFDRSVFEKTTKSQTFFKGTEGIMQEVRTTLELIKENKRLSENENMENKNILADIRTTIAPSVIYNKEHILRIASEIKSLDCRWILQQFQPDIGAIVNKKLNSINPPSPEFLETIKDFCLKVYPGLNIEIKRDGFNLAELK